MARYAPVLAVAIVLGAAPTRAALDDDEVKRRATEVLRDPEFQTQRPDGQVEPAPPIPPPEIPRLPRTIENTPPVSAPSQVSQALIWIVLGAIGVAIVALLAAQLARSFRARKLGAVRSEQANADADGFVVIDPERLDATLAEALRLAGLGKLEEAVRVLLAGAIADLQARAGLATEPALTSRELLRAVGVPAQPRAAFEHLVISVEVSLFGGMPVTRNDFDRCASSFRTLRQAVVG